MLQLKKQQQRISQTKEQQQQTNKQHEMQISLKNRCMYLLSFWTTIYIHNYVVLSFVLLVAGQSGTSSVS